jgi:hypothetical protein
MSEVVSTVLTGYETADSRGFREDARAWRRDDLLYREEVRARLEHKRLFAWVFPALRPTHPSPPLITPRDHAAWRCRSEEKRRWHEEDMEQAAVENARRLWRR